ncbi:hypothetical protein P22_2561 [Propionispora sp. 2/2-37]|uniref:zinc dependent phospholipase C family protein n=1 Tax=Propionispora sp. 2/2-37 TaxID=1677858 RepID=UPI0006BB80CA|nr:zinc dependent phospholipase C family protein [Propionispora sp. 2/2-37]CUH96471.1 hypothetical protein P22_2561 [Propionispora sp. 2/2-37]
MLNGSTFPQTSVEIGAKLLLTVVSPLQGILDSPGVTHEFCNRQAVTILTEDGLERCAAFFNCYLQQLNAGVYWADSGWKNISHYFEPVTAKGLWKFKSAMEEFRIYYQQALQWMDKQNPGRAVFFLGAAAHLLQDLCVPHHARSKLFGGHKDYEQWAEKHHADYAITMNGRYEELQNPQLGLLKNALIAADLWEWVNETATGDSYHRATAILLPLAQASTAGLLHKFFEASGARSFLPRSTG